MLGSVLQYGEERLQDLLTADVQPRQMVDARHRSIFDAIVQCFDSGEDVNLVSVGMRMLESGTIDSVGASYLSALTNLDVIFPGPLVPFIREWRQFRSALSRRRELQAELSKIDALAEGVAP